jgi:Protein of unknown function (DUF1376)
MQNDQLPDPLVPADVDLRDFPFMPVDIRRLLTSETWMLGTGDQRSAAMALWLESWHQVPAASLPDNDRMLQHLSQCPNWKRIRPHVLRGWRRCSDGRLYHPVVAEKALEAWLEKLAQRISSGAGNAKRWGTTFDSAPIEAQMVTARSRLHELNPQSRALSKRRAPDVPAASQRESHRDSRRDRKGQGEGQGEGQREESPPPNVGGDDRAQVRTDVGRYAFEGRVIRLDQADFDRWRKAYDAIPDLRAELHSLDDWLAQQPEAKRKAWFQTTSGALSRKHQEHLARRPPEQPRKPAPRQYQDAVAELERKLALNNSNPNEFTAAQREKHAQLENERDRLRRDAVAINAGITPLGY